MNDWLENLESTIADCNRLREEYPDLPSLESLHLQLQYLINLESGVIEERSRLRDITIGVIAAREIEALDMNFATKLHEIAAVVRYMK